MPENRTLSRKEEELVQAKALAIDPRANAIQRLAPLLGLDDDHFRAIVQAIDLIVLPLVLEMGSSSLRQHIQCDAQLRNHCNLQSKSMHNHGRIRFAFSRRKTHAKT